MIVYIESNFILEIAFRQEEEESAKGILELARKRRIKLAFPMFSLGEPYATLIIRDTGRKRLLQDLNAEREQLTRSAGKQTVVDNLSSTSRLLSDVSKAHADALESCVEKLLHIGRPFPTDSKAFARAKKYKEVLQPKDSIIYASMTADIRKQELTEPKCFITRDKDFQLPQIRRNLKKFNCKILSSYKDGLDYMNNS